jgi:large subunit ribosomal protein L10
MTNEDYLEPAKAIYNFTKDHDFYKIKGGVVEGKVMTAEEIITLAKLPSKETLLSMLAGGLLGTISKFAVALDQVRLQKEAQA